MLSDTGHDNELPTTKVPAMLTSECLTPEIKYDEELHTLWIGNGRPSPNGMDLFDGCVVFFDTDRRVSGFMLEDAREVLIPFLRGNAIGSNASDIGD